MGNKQKILIIVLAFLLLFSIPGFTLDYLYPAGEIVEIQFNLVVVLAPYSHFALNEARTIGILGFV